MKNHRLCRWVSFYIMLLLIRESVIKNIFSTIGIHTPESGGILGSNRENIITHFEFDKYNVGNKNSYIPNIQYLNNIITNIWSSNNIKFCGLIHSHPVLYSHPSRGDIEYGKVVIEAFEYLNKIYLPILGIENKNLNLDFYCLYKNKNIVYKIKYDILSSF